MIFENRVFQYLPFNDRTTFPVIEFNKQKRWPAQKCTLTIMSCTENNTLDRALGISLKIVICWCHSQGRFNIVKPQHLNEVKFFFMSKFLQQKRLYLASFSKKKYPIFRCVWQITLKERR